MFSAVFIKRHPAAGARPGTLVIPDEAPPPRIRLITYGRDKVEEKSCTSEDLQQFPGGFNDNSVAWVDVQGLGNKQLICQIGDNFQLHPLLLEDIVNVPQRPKSESYGDQLLIIVRMVRLNDEQQIEMEQVSVVVGPKYVLTFQEKYGDVFDPVRKRIREDKGPIRKHGVDYLAYAVIDTVVDAYYPALEQIGDQIESLESSVVNNPSTELLASLNQLKNYLVNLRRGIWPQRESVNGLVRGDHVAITEEVRLFFRDTYDHCIQASEVTEMYREMVTGLISVYLSSIANRTNEVMKLLTIVATMFIPLTFLAGIYGMNFENMPELHTRWGYPVAWGVMIVISIALLTFFWKRGWIGPDRKS